MSGKETDELVNEPWDPTHTSGPTGSHWTSTNVGEAAPGVLTPLASTHWHMPLHRTGMRALHAMGVVSGAERFADVSPEQRVVRLFYGRLSARIEFMTLIGDRMPGVTGAEVLVSLLGEAPGTIEYRPTARRYPFIALRSGRQYAVSHARLREMSAKTDLWWRHHVAAVPLLDEQALARAVVAGAEGFEQAMGVHLTALFSSVQPTYDALERLVAQAGTGDTAVLCGTGGAEMAVVGDLWRASRDEIPLAAVVANHGFHGPDEGEVSSTVWRDDDGPLRSAVELYRARPDHEAPDRTEAEKDARRVEMTQELLSALPSRARPGARLVLKLARERIPDRGRGKRALLQGIDVTRMAARRLGEIWSADGTIESPDDIFYLTAEEIGGALPARPRDLIALRRRRREIYQSFEFASPYWRGEPELVPVAEASRVAALAAGEVLSGTGASPGVVEGIARIVTDPTFEDVEPDEVLVAKTTDPSWCSIMFVSAALVVDLGGALSHAAVVARELDIPCVVNTANGTSTLRTGDRVRVDGTAGTVTLLEPARS